MKQILTSSEWQCRMDWEKSRRLIFGTNVNIVQYMDLK